MLKALVYSEIQNWEDREIDSQLRTLKKSLFDLKMEKMSKGLKNSQDISVLKKNIARLLTAKNWKKHERS